jgi:hypothetical protein
METRPSTPKNQIIIPATDPPPIKRKDIRTTIINYIDGGDEHCANTKRELKFGEND